MDEQTERARLDALRLFISIWQTQRYSTEKGIRAMARARLMASDS